jgi:predicted ATPase
MHRRTLRDAFGRHGGIEKGTEGDSFFVVFAEAPAAIAAAVDGQRGLASERWPPGAEVRVRMGLHTGRGRLVEGDYVGLDVHRAARIAAAAHGGQVVVSETTRALAEHDLPQGVELQDLGRQKLRDLPDQEQLFQLVIPGLPGDFPPLHTTGQAGNLPVPLTTFVGRKREVGELSELFQASRLVTLVGPAGTGKTRLALEAARRAAQGFRDGAWFVGLESIADPSQVPAAVAAAVGVREVGGKSPVAVLEDHLRPRRCLVVLDNFEHLLAAGPLVTDLLTAAPGLTIAATSQAELRLSGEQLYPVLPLGIGAPDGSLESDATRLFVERATSAMPDFIVTPEATRLISEICSRLDGLPLAIELAAARVRLLGIEEILRRLDSRLALLSTGPSDVPDRHRTLRAALAWSHDLLAPPEAILFRRLAVFSGGASLAATERVCSDPAVGASHAPVGDPLIALDELVRHSLLQADPGAEGTRYRMLETVREFALERLIESGEAPVIRGRHARWCAELLESLAPLVRLRPAAAGRAEAEIDNVQSALEWAADSGDVEVGLRICGSAWRVWWRRGRVRDGLAWTQRFLGLGNGDAFTPPRIRALEGAGGIAYWLGEGTVAVAAYRERLALAARHGPASEVADAHLDLWFGLVNIGETGVARAELAAARAGYEAIGDELGLARCEWVESSLLVMERHFSEARENIEELLVVFRRHGDVTYASLAMGSLAMCSLAMGDLDVADHWFREVLTLGESAGVAGSISGLGGWSLLLGHLGHPRLAARFQGAYEGLSQTYGIQMSPRLRDVIAVVLAQAGPGEELDPRERHLLIEEGRRMTLDEVLESARRLSAVQEKGSSDLESLS